MTSLNRAPLRPQPYQSLPLGTVQARSWLKHQLVLQKEGLTGHAEELYDDIGNSDWLTGEGRGGEYDWERGPYYAKGLISLAYVLDDPELKDKAQPWVEQVLKSQRENGDFGPKEKNWWANMIVLHYLRDYYDATQDERVTDFLRNYFKFQLEELPAHPLSSDSNWAKARGGDNLEIVYWLYNQEGEAWLMDLARLLIEQTNEWHKFYASNSGDNAIPEHIVNLMQGLKAPALSYLLTGDPDQYHGYQAAFDSDGWLWINSGRIDGMLSGTEPICFRFTNTGTELCAIVERILSATVALQITGEAPMGDDLERVAYNALPASLTPDIKGLRYYILPNQPKCTNEVLGFENNGTDEKSICPSPHSGFGCCRSNFHFGWPKFVHHMWLATADHGLAAAMYGPNQVTASVGTDSIPVTITQETDYPFKSDVHLKVEPEKPVQFPLELRIPQWCTQPSIKVNGELIQDTIEPGTFYRLNREWQTGDRVELTFPMPLTTSHWQHNSICIDRGPLAFSLLIKENTKTVETYLDGSFATREILPDSPWDVALLADKIQESEVVTADTMPTQPFLAETAPVKIKLKAFRPKKSYWGGFFEVFPARAFDPPPSPIQQDGELQDITLVPYGSTEIRITHFPWAE